jgi:hypothetical protein
MMTDGRLLGRAFVAAAVVAIAAVLGLPMAASASTTLIPHASGELDCNGYSTIQTAIRRTFNCTDLRGFDNEWNANTWDGRFYDNGVYIGHDEPDMTFVSNRPGSGDNVTWTESLPRDPWAKPTVADPGHDVVHWFELSPAPWFSMALCDPNSYPETSCTPESDANAPTCVGVSTTNCFAGGASAVMEMQFYPPGNPPFADSESCDDTHWCAALTIDSLECTVGFAVCNGGCEEPVNFGFIQRDGVPTGPPSPQESNLATLTPNGQTLLMSPGDRVTVSMFDAPAPGGGRAFEVVVHDWSTGQVGWMQASAANGFANTSAATCDGTPFNFQPEFNTAARNNIVGWAALQTNISTEYETGHFEPCTSLSDPLSYTFSNSITGVTSPITDTFWNVCNGPYEDNDADETTEPGDGVCYPAGYTHGALDSQPDLVTGCQDDYFQNGDLDFDGTPYYADWPVGQFPTRTLPSSFVEEMPTFDGWEQYSQYFIQTDIALSEADCSATTGVGCSVPPVGPGGFYPYWSRADVLGHCTIEFGNVSSGLGVDDLGGDAQYGSDQSPTLGYPEYEGPSLSNACGWGPHF